MGFSFDGVESKAAGGYLEPGTYTCRVRDPEAVVSKGGTPGIEVRFEDEAGGGIIFDTQWVTVRTLPYLKHRLESVGVALPSGQWEASKGDPAFMAMVRALDGKRVKVTVGTEPDRDDPSRVYARVKAWDKPSGQAPAGVSVPAAAPQDDSIPF